ncbi:MAG: cupin domain-containing protein [Syntrophales bacterium]
MKAARVTQLVPFLLFLFVCLCSVGAGAAEYAGVTVTVIKKGTTAANGQRLTIAKAGTPEVTAALVEIPPGGDTGWHSHPILVYAYVLSGAITAELGDGKRYDFKEGEVILEVIDTPHIGRNRGTAPAKLVVFYTGVEGVQNTVKVAK